MFFEIDIYDSIIGVYLCLIWVLVYVIRENIGGTFLEIWVALKRAVVGVNL